MDERGSDAAAKLRAILAHAPVFVFAIGQDGRFTLWDGHGPAALGLSAEQVVGQSAFELYRDLAKATPALRTAVRRSSMSSGLRSTHTAPSLLASV